MGVITAGRLTLGSLVNPNPPCRPLKAIILILCAAAVVIGALWSRDSLTRKRAFAERTACVGSLNRIRLTKLVYSEDHNLTNSAVIPDEIIWRENGVTERCHSGGQYSINAVGVDPSCSYTGVVRWSGRLWRHVWPE
jgi:hypothetical protein